MSEDLDPLTDNSEFRVLSRNGILLVMAAVVVVLSAAGFLFKGTAFGIGVLIGGILSYGNYLWLDRSTKAILINAAASNTGLLAAKYILRYFALGAVLLLIHLTGILPVGAVIIGLAGFALAVMLTGLRNVFARSI